ncbi:pilus assembly protein [Rheinheimera sp. MMS21-TC3]|uniref:pilus assembly protein n=1 Tax=Rheinheimera sp. MMS21-TC3 TaxID=3072790 RepID=UPI0028C3E8AF|nr:PilC/PilY family type IV pilus protein [Rheinheimera sp. MMS21-TC3]WNO59997.1 PilC/PilY family type IV pilus protein [Rheinheimera sp. MMS21-TC3]
MRAFIKKSLMFVISLNAGVAISVSASTLAIPNVPLQTASEVPANIMFLIDDSGSMNFEFIPDSINGYQGAPQVEICSSWWSCAWVRSGENVTYKWYYSSHVNSSYYDNDVTYEVPPSASDPLSEPTYNTAWRDGFAKTGARNLNNNFEISYHQLNSDHSSITSQGSLTFDKGGFYYKYAPSAANAASCSDNRYQNKCYTYVSMNSASAADKKNFAIWYSYYRSRLLLARSGIGIAFINLPENVRVGYGALNTSPKIERGVREFSGSGKTGFYSWLYGKGASGGTPLRLTLKAAGEYFKTESPYLVNPAIAKSSSNPIVSCRQNFSILMTDGAWNGDSPSVGDQDGDNVNNTLADVGYYYYKTDLMPGLTNDVPKPTPESPDWQHMVTFGVGLGVDGTIENVEDAKTWPRNDSRWPNPTQSPDVSLKKTDDLLHASVNSDGDFFSAKDPVTFSKLLADALDSILGGVASATNLATTTTTLREENSIFQASFNTEDWSGKLVSNDVADLSQQWVSNFKPWASRPIYSSRTDTSGATISFEFNWANLTSSERTVLESEDIVNYLRGDKSKENPTGALRKRSSLLGDIAHSSPVYVGAPQNRGYQRYNWPGANSYNAFVEAKKNRLPAVYVGANDGMFHGFDADPVSATKGQEIFAYVPQRMLTASAQLSSYAKKTYSHRFYVDGVPTLADVYIDGEWRSVLVSTLGRGGSSIFALDVTDPSDISLLWDLDIPELGIMTSKPIITRLNNGKWSVIAGYGHNNTANKSGILVIDIENAATAPVIKLETSGTESIGMAQLEGWDHNKNGNTDWIFAGDIQGNVWKFDLSSSTWHVGYGGTPLFVAKDSAGNPQPITGGVTLQSHPDTAELWVFFGTGKFIESGDNANTDIQSWYGIKDGSAILTRSQLVDRTMVNIDYTNPDTGEVRQARRLPTVDTNDMIGKRGWVMDLVDTRERITSKPRFVGGNLVMNSIIPDIDLCNPEGDGWVMAVDPFKGSRLNYHFFDLSRDNEFKDSDGLPDGAAASGVKFEGMPGEPVFVGDEMIVGTSKVALDASRVNLEIRRGRLSWREIIN